MMHRAGRIVLKSLLMFATMGICLALAELCLRKLDLPRAQFSGWKSASRVRSALELNELGYRGQHIAIESNDFVVVLTGDSQVLASACSYYRLPESRLELHLGRAVAGRRIRVFSVGTDGYGQDQQLAAMREYFAKYRADLVLLWFTPGNDIFNNLFPALNLPRGGHAKPTYRLEGDELVGPLYPWGTKVSHRFRLVQMLMNVTRYDAESVWERSLPPAYVSAPLTADAPAGPPWPEEKMAVENLAWEKSHEAIRLTPPSERMKYGLKLTNRLLLEIESLARSNRAGFLTFHAHFPEGAGGAAEEVFQFQGRVYRSSDAQVDANIAAALSGISNVTVEVTEFPATSGPTDAHLNETAVDQVMADLAAVVVTRMPAGAVAP